MSTPISTNHRLSFWLLFVVTVTCRLENVLVVAAHHGVPHRSLTFVRRGGSASAPLTLPTLPNTNTTQAVNDTVPSESLQQANVTSTTILPAWKASLPPILQQKKTSLQKLRLGKVDIFLIGTAHVSNDSSRDVQLLLEATKPHAIFVELCESRISLLQPPIIIHNNTTKDKSLGFWEQLTAVQQAQGGSRLQAMSTVLLTSVQEDFAKELDVTLGGEFQQAYRYWLAQGRVPHLILGDRPLHVTMVRAWESLWWWPKLKLMVALLCSCVRKPKKDEIQAWLSSVLNEESDVLTKSFDELRKHFPSLFQTIIAERDAWLAAKLVQSCRALSRVTRDDDDSSSTLVAIVGAGHVPGICQWLTNNTTTNNTTPEQILSDLVTTTRWAKDEEVQNAAIPQWVYHVTELNEMVDNSFAWAEPTSV